MALLSVGSTSFSEENIYGVSSGSWSHTIISGEDSLWVHATAYGSAGRVITGITFNGSAMTLAKDITGDFSGNGAYTCWYYIINPTVGAHDITVTFNGTGYGYGGGIAFKGTKTSSPLGATSDMEHSDANPTQSVTTAYPVSYVLQGLHLDNITPQTVTTGAGETQLYIGGGGAGRRAHASYKRAYSTGSHTMSEILQTGTAYQMALVEVKSEEVPIVNTMVTAPASFAYTPQAVGDKKIMHMITAPASFIFTGMAVEFAIKVWHTITKHTDSWSGKTKNTSAWSDKTENTSNYTYKEKH